MHLLVTFVVALRVLDPDEMPDDVLPVLRKHP